MFSADDIIEALGLRRRLKSIRPQAPGTLPPGWQQWFDAMPATPHAVKGALPQTFVDELAQRPLASPPRRDVQLNRWQAFATLWRQQWHPPIREERGLRWFAASVSAVLHLFFAVLLLFLAYVFVPPPAPEGEGQQVVQAEFIGKGTPEETGGGAPQGPQPEPAQTAAAPSPPAATPTPSPAPTQPPPPPQPEQPAPQPEQPVAAQPPPQPQPGPEPVVEVPPAPQPLQVTQVPQPDTTFVLPPPRPREVVVAPRDITVPQLRQPTQEIARVEAQRQTLETQPVEAQRIRVAPPQVRGEESARLTQQIPITSAQSQSREIALPTLRGETREIPMPSRGTTPGATTPGTSTSNAPSTTPGSATAATAAAPGGQQAPGSGTAPAAQPGAGTTPNAAPGAWPSPNRGDDWGAGTRNTPGGKPGSGAKPGIYDAQGRPNLGEPPTPGQNAPGTVEAHIADLDRAGRWLKRPPLDYTPTTFDQYWVPSETLLQEWVRKGIKSLSIPIPGTDKKISCVVSLLQFGGGCGLVDPNVNAQAARARPPPDVPFKPWLQEDNGSIKKAPPPPNTSVQVPASTTP